MDCAPWTTTQLAWSLGDRLGTSGEEKAALNKRSYLCFVVTDTNMKGGSVGVEMGTTWNNSTGKKEEEEEERNSKCGWGEQIEEEEKYEERHMFRSGKSSPASTDIKSSESGVHKMQIRAPAAESRTGQTGHNLLWPHLSPWTLTLCSTPHQKCPVHLTLLWLSAEFKPCFSLLIYSHFCFVYFISLNRTSFKWHEM